MDFKAKLLMNKICCDPFKIHKANVRKGLRKISPQFAQKFSKSGIKSGKKICARCREMLSGTISSSSSDNESVSSVVYSHSSLAEEFVSPEVELEALNKSLSAIGESPIKGTLMKRTHRYGQQKSKKIQDVIVKKLKLVSPGYDSKEAHSSEMKVNADDSEIITQLKDKFKITKKRSEELQILTVLPKSWSIKRIEQEFHVTNYMARQAKKLVSQEGVLSMPNKRESRFPQIVEERVLKFYKNEEVSRVMPGKNDYKTVMKHGVRVQEQKYLILCNLKEAHTVFKSQNPDVKISFSKFAGLRPKECILAGASGTHSVCVCTIHQNVKLMIDGANLPVITKEEENFHVTDYKKCLDKIVCSPPTSDCYFSECQNCSNLIDDFIAKISTVFHKNMIDDVEYLQWLSTDRTTLQTVVQMIDEFTEEFCRKLQILKRHNYIAKQQSTFYSMKRENLKEGEVLVHGDFSENYSFVLQDSAQGFHYNNAQATLHPFVCYYRDGVKIDHLNVVIISDCLSHDTVAVHLFQRKLINYLKSRLDFNISEIIYFSDGSVTQYKNYKNFVNLCHHINDFGLKAQWHFFATSHGKGPCDGLGGTVKRLAARASLQRPYNNQIMTPRQLFDFGKENIQGINFIYSTTDEWIKGELYLKERFENANKIPGSQKLHSFIPVSQEELEVRTVSSIRQGSKKVKVLQKTTDIQFEDVKGFVTAMYDNKWWLACVLETYVETLEVKLYFLRPNGPSTSFHYPRNPDILVIPYSDILTVADPMTTTGRIYKITEDTMNEASKKLKNKQR